MATQLTVLIAVKNHEGLIGDCIRSVSGMADEVLIADSGSTDSTIPAVHELCEGLCDVNVIARDYITAGSFKNWAIPQASHAWVLILDVDERLTVALAAEVKALLCRGPEADGYYIYRDNYFMGHRVRFGGWNRDRVIRLIRRDQFRYPDQAADHSEFETEGLSILRLKNHMKHYTRCSYDEHLEKCRRYTALQAQRWHREGRRSSFLQMMFRPPLRFLRSYIAYGGVFDGMAGLQIAYMAAYYAYLKQARLWELNHGLSTSKTEVNQEDSRRVAA